MVPSPLLIAVISRCASVSASWASVTASALLAVSVSTFFPTSSITRVVVSAAPVSALIAVDVSSLSPEICAATV
jgi:hypothetical protein